MDSTTKGNDFRDVVAQLLKAAGYQNVQIEKPLPGKNVDVYAELPGFVRERYAFEAKDYESSIGNHLANKFMVDYGALLNGGHITKAVLISRSSITSSAMSAMATARTSGMTFEDFQRHIFGIPDYVAEIAQQHQSDPASSFYVPATIEDGDLEARVKDWLGEPHNRPLVVLGGYGSGKSTFAWHLTGALASESLSDPTARIPVRIKLGELTEQNNLEGLFGAHFTAEYSVRGYSWNLFRQLNRRGRFLIILDGFDEMKHGMTFAVFKRQFDRLLSLSEGAAKILILGRDTAFRDDVEFRAIIHGKKTTPNGTEMADASRPECDHVKLEPFSLSEAHRFINGYFPYLAKQERGTINAGWVSSRLIELCSDNLKDIVMKPVHAQMLCRVATQPSVNLVTIDQFGLYDRFVHYLLERESSKPGRFAGFDASIRRAANAAISWWLFCQEGASTTSVANAPVSLFRAAAADVEHDFDNEGLVRELAQGCLVEKNNDVVYFGHRSIQEFLAAEHLYSSQLAPRNEGVGSVAAVCRWSTEQVNAFLAEMFQRREDRGEVAQAAMETFARYRGQIDLDRLDPFLIAARYNVRARGVSGANVVWASWLSANSVDEAALSVESMNDILAVIRRSRIKEEVLAAVQLLYWAASAVPQDRWRFNKAAFITSFIEIPQLSSLVSLAEGQQQALPILSDDQMKLFLLLSCSSVSTEKGVGTSVTLDLDKMNETARAMLGYSAVRTSSEHGRSVPLVVAEIQAVAQQVKGELVLEGKVEQSTDMEVVRRLFRLHAMGRISPVASAISKRSGSAMPSRARPFRTHQVVAKS